MCELQAVHVGYRKAYPVLDGTDMQLVEDKMESGEELTIFVFVVDTFRDQYITIEDLHLQRDSKGITRIFGTAKVDNTSFDVSLYDNLMEALKAE